jgi:hypothetical protein
MNRVEVGQRVRSNTEFDTVTHEGTIQKILVGVTAQGPTAIFHVLIDRKNGEQIEPHLHESPALHWDHLSEEGTTTSMLGGKVSPPKCTGCGEVHGEGPEYFTPEMIALHAQLGSTPEEDREAVYVELAGRFMAQTSELDADMPDHIHKLVAKAHDAGEEARRALLRVGRMVVKNLDARAQHMQGAARMRKLFTIPVPVTNEKAGGLN